MLAVLLMMEDGKDKDKLEKLYDTYKKDLFYVAYNILHNYHDAEDVLQNAFIKISKNIKKIGEINCNKTKAYLVIIVRNLSYDRHNEKKKVVPMDLDVVSDEDVNLNSSLDDHVLRLEKGEELAKALARLGSNYADILTLRYYYECENEEIAEIINLSKENVAIRLCRARAALRKLLTEGGEY
jgi:RNA polymerase sigma-70 factor (ECF subfamily)